MSVRPQRLRPFLQRQPHRQRGLTVEYTSFNTSDSQDLELAEGDLPVIDLASDAGSVDVRIQSPDSTPVFDSESLATGHYEIQIDQDGTYSCMVTGHRAKGSIHIYRETAEQKRAKN